MWLTNSSLGRKVVMSVTGLFLILFVTFHVLMNTVALISPDGYNLICEFLGANWYALLGTAILAAGFIVHIIYAFWLTLQNRKARGNDRYAVTSRPKSVEWASQNMLSQMWTLPVYVIGLVALWFHMTHGFWSSLQSLGASNGKWIPRLRTLGNWWATIVIALFIIQAVVFTCKFA